MINAKLIITLKSDLCAASGYSYAGLIDSDICFDKYGLPYVPARRLKGCLKQSAEDYLLGEFLDAADIDEIFGISGSKKSGVLRVSNAYIEDAKAIQEELKLCIDNDLVTADKVLNYYTHVQAQTRMEDGVARDNTLRYTRILNHKSAANDTEMILVSELLIDTDNTNLFFKIQNIAKATRNIGLKRNRGLGSVRCEIVKVSDSESGLPGISDGDELVELTYTVRNVDALMISMQTDNESIKYIPGQTVLGYFAAEYIKNAGITNEEASNDKVFADLFLNGKTRYTNLLPSENGCIYYPAPIYINRLKKSKAYVNTLFTDAMNEDSFENENYDPRYGNQPKKLKGKFLYYDGKFAVREKEVDMQMVYHHSKKSESRNGEEGLLYGLEVLEAGQEFTSKIYVLEKYAALLKKILQSGNLTFGKSKSAQYGSCELLNVTEKAYAKKDTKYADAVVVTLLSDAVFINDRGEYTVYEDEVCEVLLKQLGIDEADEIETMLQTKEIKGYSAVWNLRKIVMPAIAAGSCFKFKLKNEAVITNDFVGERNIEGLGQIRVDAYRNMRYEVEKAQSLVETDTNNAGIKNVREMLEQFLIESVMDRLKLKAINEKKYAAVSSSSLGRITLMLKESMLLDSEAAKGDFEKRINSIKTESTKKEALEIYRKVTKISCDENEIEKSEKQLMDLLGYSIDDLNNKIGMLWNEYAMNVLTLQKYLKSEKEV